MNGREYTIKPGLLVVLSTRIRGGVQYTRSDETEQRLGEEEFKKWTTEKHVTNVDELERATKTRGKARSLVAGACIKSEFGLLCPDGDDEKLRDRQREANQVVADHNALGTGPDYPRVDLYIITGRVASDDRDAVRAIFADIGDAVRAMRQGIADLKPEAIREAASRAKSVGRMLDPEQEERVGEAVKSARSAARKIIKLIGDKSEPAASEVIQLRREIDTTPIAAERFAFLDLDAETPSGPEPEHVAAEIETSDETQPEPAPTPAPTVELDADTETADEPDLFAPAAELDTVDSAYVDNRTLTGEEI